MNYVYGVFCEVFGGVTGHRTSWLKKDGKRFEGTREEAEMEAEKARELVSRNAGATFNYSVVKLGGAR